MNKKLIEVAIPLEAINKESSREKSIRHGHPSTLHLWWARRPLATARAVLFASLVDDPSSHPELFPTEEEQNKERLRLFHILEELIKWENSNNQTILNIAKNEIAKYVPGTVQFLDPFAGGGAIPLEANRIGLETYAHDLNPVSVLINKAMIEFPSNFNDVGPINSESNNNTLSETYSGIQGLAEDVRYYGELLRHNTWDRVKDHYPHVCDKEERKVIAWIWSRTIPCPNPMCRCKIPLIKSTTLSVPTNYYIKLQNNNGEITTRITREKPEIEGTVNRKGILCPNCNNIIQFKPYIYDYFKNNQIENRLIAVITEGERNGKQYYDADELQIKSATVIRPEVPKIKIEGSTGNLNVINYGFNYFSDLFTDRQLYVLTIFTEELKKLKNTILEDIVEYKTKFNRKSVDFDSNGYAKAIITYLSFVIDKLADYNSSICSWHSSRQIIGHTFARQAIPMAWDFAESNPFSGSSGSFDNMLDWVIRCIQQFPINTRGKANQHNAMEPTNLSNLMISTDPPYYDNVDYGDLSDFFYLWLRQSLKDQYPDLLSTIRVPKDDELIAFAHRHEGSKEKAKQFFEEGMLKAFKEIYKCARNDIPVTIYYAFKQKEIENKDNSQEYSSSGWETFLNAVIQSGFVITGTWPMRTEMSTRMINHDSNALNSSIVLVCRKKKHAGNITQREFLSELRKELKESLTKLQKSNIAPVDLAQSAIGPGISVYSRYENIIQSDGSRMNVKTALQIINRELDSFLNENESTMDAESRFCLELYSNYAYNELSYGDADILAKAKNASIERMKASGIIYSEKGKVSLIERDKIVQNYSERHEKKISTVWHMCQYLTGLLEHNGIEECAKFLVPYAGTLPGDAKSLAYHLFTIAEKKKWTQEAIAYNSLVTAWPDIQVRKDELVEQLSPKEKVTLDRWSS